VAASRKIHASATETRPAGMARESVRGFRASMRRSAMRLKVIALERAPTIATRIPKKVGQPMRPSEATRALIRAKGRAKTVCWNLIISSSTPTLPNRGLRGVVTLSIVTSIAEAWHAGFSPVVEGIFYHRGTETQRHREKGMLTKETRRHGESMRR